MSDVKRHITGYNYYFNLLLLKQKVEGKTVIIRIYFYLLVCIIYFKNITFHNRIMIYLYSKLLYLTFKGRIPMDNLLLKKDLTADQMVLVTSEFEKEKSKGLLT